MVYKILLILIFCLNFGCTPTNQGLTDLVGGETTKTTTVPSDLGNQAFQFTPESYDFGNRAVNSAPVSTSVTIRNISSHTVYLSNVSGPTGTFSLISDNCPRSPNAIVPNQSCTATISFAPNIGGVLNSSLIMTYGASVSNNAAYTASMGLSGTGVGTLSFTGIDSVSDIYSTQLKLNWTHVAGTLVYYVFKVNADNSLTLVANVTPPTATYIVSGLTASTTYKYWVRAMDTVGAFDANTNVVTTATNNNPPAPVLGGYTAYTFASTTAITLGSTLSVDFNDVRTGVASDAGVTYSCSGFDQTVNSSVTASGNCGSLLGTFSLSTTSGALSWTTTTQGAIGFYEIKMIVTDTTSSLTGTAIFVVDVKPTYLTTNLVGNYSANFANAISSQTNETTWQDLTTFNNDGTLTNFTFGGSYGWLGAGTIASPYRLGFDGVNDYVDLNTLANTATSLTLEAWAQPTQISTSPVGIIMSNADSSANGLMIREAKGYRGRVEAVIGDTTYADVVLSDTPLNYLRMGDVSGAAIYDSGTSPVTWTPKNLSNGYEKQGVVNSSDKGFQFSGNFTCLKSASTIDPAAWAGITYEVNVNFTTTAGIQNLISHSTESATNSFVEWYLQGGWLVFNYSNGVSTSSKNYLLNPTIGNWYHIVATVDFATQKHNLYVNGVHVVVDSAVTFNYTNWPSKYVVVGCYADQNQWPVNGYMDEVAVYNSVLSPARVLAHYNAKSNYYSCLSNSLDVSKWHHLAASFDDTSQSLNLMANGNNDCGISTSGITLNASSAQMSFGAKVPAVNSPTAGTYFQGEITDARVYDTALTSTQLKANMASQIDKMEIPKSIAGLNLWLKADALTGYANNAPVSTWTDSSTAGRNATALATEEPLYIANSVNGRPALRFDGVNDQMTIGTAGNGWTFFCVGKQLGPQGGGVKHFVMGTGIWTATTTQFGGNLSWYHAQWAAYQTTMAGANYNWHVQSFRGTTTFAEAWVDGVLGWSYTGTFTIGNLVTIGNGTGDIRWINGDIAEIIAYSGTLSDAERKRVEGYLKAKYGL